MKSVLWTAAVFLGIWVSAAEHAHGDDTDVFLAHSEASSGRSLVMLVLDLHPRLAEVRCLDVTAPDCRDKLGVRVFAALDLLSEGSFNQWKPGADGLPDARQIPDDGALIDAWLAHDSRVTRLDEIRAGLQVALAGPVFRSPRMRLGMMLNHARTCDQSGTMEAGDAPQCSQGAYILKGFFQPTLEAGTPSGALQSLFDSLAAVPQPTAESVDAGWSGHPYQLKDLYLEFYRYLSGGEVYNGLLHYADFRTVDDLTAPAVIGGRVSAALLPDRSTYVDSADGSRYISPLLPVADWACSDITLVNLLLGEPVGHSASVDRFEAVNSLEQLLQASDAVSVIGILAEQDVAATGVGPGVDGKQVLTSHFISVGGTVDVSRWAEAGLGKGISRADQPLGLVASVQELLTVGGPEGTTLAATSSALNVYDRSRMVDRLYLAMFQARSDMRWPGNIKKFRISVPAPLADGPVAPVGPGVVGAKGNSAFADDNGLAHAALSYWTDPKAADVSPPHCVSGQPPLAIDEICGADGRSVTRGGAGQLISGLSPGGGKVVCQGAGPGSLNHEPCARQLYVENPAGQGPVIDFNRDDLTAAMLAPLMFPAVYEVDPDALQQTSDIIGWARGLYELTPGGNREQTKRWLLGDVIHSRPLAVNYGDRGGADGYSRLNPDVRLFFGSNDGWFRSLRDTEPDGQQSGREAWAVLPLEFLPLQAKRAANLPVREADLHPYGIDGAPVALVLDADLDGNVETVDGDRVYVFFGLRRGGRAYYALDVSNPDSPPSLLWKISNLSPGFAELGLSFSTPTLARVNYDGTGRTVLIFAGGYNGGWDADGFTRVGKDLARAPDTVGNAVFVVDAISGELIWKAVRADNSGAVTPVLYGHSGLQHSVASALSVVDINQDGIDDRAYVGDTGGTVWRLDMPVWDGAEDARERWTLSELASLAGAGDAGDRRFFHAPDVVLAEDEINVAGEGEAPVYKRRRYVGVVIASGNRAAPADNRSVNFIYYLKDTIAAGIAQAAPLTHPVAGSGVRALLNVNSCPQGAEVACQLHTRAMRAASLRNGWLLELSAEGEKGLSSPITVDGTVFFASHTPAVMDAAANCAATAPGSRFYAVDVSDGSAKPDLLHAADDDPVAPRFIQLDASGIPDRLPLILLGSGKLSPSGEQDSDPAPDSHLLLPDGSLFDLVGGRRWKAYWREFGVDPD